MVRRAQVRGTRVTVADKKVYYSKYRDAARRLVTALRRARSRDDYSGGDLHVTAAFSAHMYNALLSELRARHGVSQPRPSDMIPTISDVPLNHHALSNYIVIPSHFRKNGTKCSDNERVHMFASVRASLHHPYFLSVSKGGSIDDVGYYHNDFKQTTMASVNFDGDGWIGMHMFD